MGRKIFEKYPIPWDENFLKYPIASHGTKQFLKVSHGIPWDEYFLQNIDFIMNSITVFVIDGSLANPGRKIRLSDPVGSYRKTIEFYRIRQESIGSWRNPWYRIPTASCRLSESVRIPSFQHFPISDNFLSESGAKDFDNFRQDLVGIIGIRWGDFDLGFQPIQVRYK
jgi:hypothetical protein